MLGRGDQPRADKPRELAEEAAPGRVGPRALVMAPDVGEAGRLEVAAQLAHRQAAFEPAELVGRVLGAGGVAVQPGRLAEQQRASGLEVAGDAGESVALA